MRKPGLCCRPVSVRPSVTYSTHMAEDIVKLLSPPGSPITLVFRPRRRYPIPRGTASVGAQSTRGLGNICDFRPKSPFISETVRDRPMVAIERLYYMKSYALYRMMTFSRIFTDPYPGFQGHGIFYVEYLINFFAPGLRTSYY